MGSYASLSVCPSGCARMPLWVAKVIHISGCTIASNNSNIGILDTCRWACFNVKLHFVLLVYRICFKKFKWKAGLNMHKRKHLGLKAFKCNLCSAAFYNSGHLKSHKLSHTGTVRLRFNVASGVSKCTSLSDQLVLMGREINFWS